VWAVLEVDHSRGVSPSDTEKGLRESPHGSTMRLLQKCRHRGGEGYCPRVWGDDERGSQRQNWLREILPYDWFCCLGQARRKGGDSVSAEDKEVRVVSAREDTTEEYSFDALAKGLASGTISRRKALKLAGAAILGGGLLAFGPAREAEAAQCGSESGCNRECRTKSNCRCVRTVGGEVRCVHPCCSGRFCNTNRRCRDNEVCMTINCCGSTEGREGVCVRRCGAPRPGYCDRNFSTATQEWGENAA